MARIVLKVSSDTAKKWRAASKETKERISQIIEILIAKEIMAPNEFKNFLDEIRKTMEKRGLTEEILQEILAEDD